jgi:hypothetical protein
VELSVLVVSRIGLGFTVVSRVSRVSGEYDTTRKEVKVLGLGGSGSILYVVTA